MHEAASVAATGHGRERHRRQFRHKLWNAGITYSRQDDETGQANGQGLSPLATTAHNINGNSNGCKMWQQRQQK